MIFQIDKTIYEQLSETERYIVDFISQNEDKISYLSITNIANKTFSSQPQYLEQFKNVVLRESQNCVI